MNNSSLVAQLEEDFLRCKICFQSFSQPKALSPCLHTYCENCLREYIYSRGYDQQGHFPCPECRRQITIPPAGVGEFQDNFMIVSLQDTVTQQVISTPGPADSSTMQPTQADGTTNNINLNLNYRGNMEVEQTSPAQVERVSSNTGNVNNVNLNLNYHGSMNISSRSVGTPHSTGQLQVTPTRPPRPQRLPRTPAPPTPDRLYPILPEAVEQPVPDQGSIPLTPSTRNPPTVLPQIDIPICYNRHGAILCFGQYGEGLADFSNPVGLVISPHGFVIISDQRDNRILIFEKLGKLKTIYTSAGEVQDISINSKGNVVIANSDVGQALAVAHDMRGRRVAAYGSHFTYEKPHGIAVTKRDNIIISTLETKLLYRLNDKGKMVQKFKAKSRDGRGLKTPLFVATNYQEDMIVSDHGNNCVRVFNKVGGLKFQIGGKPGHKPGQLKQPKGVCCDGHGNIIVADGGNHRVQVFSHEGKFMDVLFEVRGEIPGSEVQPQNVAIQGDKLVVMVTGPQYAQVRVYQYNPERVKYNMCACQ